MANRTNHPKKNTVVEEVINESIGIPIEESIIVEKPVEVVTIENTILLENIQSLRFVDLNGKLFRLELRSSGVYWLYPV